MAMICVARRSLDDPRVYGGGSVYGAVGAAYRQQPPVQLRVARREPHPRHHRGLHEQRAGPRRRSPRGDRSQQRIDDTRRCWPLDCLCALSALSIQLALSSLFMQYLNLRVYCSTRGMLAPLSYFKLP